MNKDSVESGQYLLALRLEHLGEGYICCDREEGLVVNLRFNPIHQQGNVLRSRQVNGFLIFYSVLDNILNVHLTLKNKFCVCFA